MTYRLTLPYPPVRYWQPDRVELTELGRGYRDEVIKIARLSGCSTPLANGVQVCIDLYPTEGKIEILEGAVAVVLHSIRGIAFITNSQIVSLKTDLYLNGGGDKPRAEVLIRQLLR